MRIARVDQRQDNRENRETAGEISCAVERVDQPEPTGRSLATALLLAVGPIIREMTLNLRSDERFRLAIGDGDRVRPTFHVDGEATPKIIEKNIAGAVD